MILSFYMNNADGHHAFVIVAMLVMIRKIVAEKIQAMCAGLVVVMGDGSATIMMMKLFIAPDVAGNWFMVYNNH